MWFIRCSFRVKVLSSGNSGQGVCPVPPSQPGCMDESGHRRKGRAPVASLEDLSDESPPEDKCRLALPGIREDSGRMMGPAPRIDISRASSSSHQDDSSPERELLAGGSGEGGGAGKYGLGFTEEMAQELRSSTEELDFQDPQDAETKVRRKKLQSQQAVTKYELEAQSEKECQERKDSACSEGGLLFIGGRTSRLSSIGSAASGGSVASGVSAGSGASVASRLSAASNYSRASRCSSPHRMMLETSFCGPKPIPSLSIESQDPEAVLLGRQADPTGAVLPKLYSGKSKLEVKAKAPAKPAGEGRHRRPKKAPRSKKKTDDDELVKIIPLHGSLDDGGDSEPEEGPTEPPSPPVDGIYIPLKGPDPVRPDTVRPEPRPEPKKGARPPVEENDLVRFISLHGDDDEELQRNRKEQTHNRNGHNVQFKPWTEDAVYPVGGRERRKAEPPGAGKSAPHKLDLAGKHGQGKQSFAQAARPESRTPSPATSFTRGSIFRRSSDSSNSSKRSQGESKSKKDSKNKSVFTSLFKKAPRDKSGAGAHSNEASVHIDSKITNVEFKFKQEERKQEGDTIIIPLHSPDSIVEPLVLLEPDREEEREEIKIKDIKKDKSPESGKAPTEATSEVGQSMAKNVIVVDVINEDKIVAIEDLSDMKKELSRESIKKERSIEIMKRNLSHETLKRNVSHESMKKELSRESIKKEPPQEAIKKEVAPPLVTRRLSLEKATPVHSVYEPSRIETVKPVSQNEPMPVVENSVLDETGGGGDLEAEEEYFPARSNTTESETTVIENHYAQSSHEEQRSSGSENEIDLAREKESSCEDDTERKSLFQQTDSVEEELPYVPTTLPQERSVAVPIIPVKQRVSEIKTYPIERPRSTTPINPTCLDDYTSHDESSTSSSSSGKMQIVLPRSDSIKSSKYKSPVKGKPWSVFAEECLQSPKEGRKVELGSDSPPPPPLPPRAGPAPSWVCFDEVPERKRAPKRITTLPSRPQPNVVYSYVNPEECSCECHEPKHCSQIKH